MTNQTRTYNCKNEELPVICSYVAFSLRRDLPDFTAYSPKLNQAYLDDFEAKTNAIAELLNPRSETLDLKAITTRLYATMESCNTLLYRLVGYIKLAKDSIPVSATDFGITAARKKLRSKDAEGAMQCLKNINDNIKKYKAALTKQGLTDELVDMFAKMLISITADNQKQYEIISNRKALVQKNVAQFNALNEQLMEICHVGKALYKGNDSLKLQEYTFTELKKRVRIVVKPIKEKPESSK